jgi:hypothetical protein
MRSKTIDSQGGVASRGRERCANYGAMRVDGRVSFVETTVSALTVAAWVRLS